MTDEPRISFALPGTKRDHFKMACLVLGVTMTDVLRAAVDATIAEAGQLRQYSDRTEYVKRGGRRVRVSFDVGEEE